MGFRLLFSIMNRHGSVRATAAVAACTTTATTSTTRCTSTWLYCCYRLVFSQQLHETHRTIRTATARQRIDSSCSSFLSTSSSSAAAAAIKQYQLPNKFIGLGGHKAHRIPFPEYCRVVQMALEQHGGMPVLESTSVASYSSSESKEEHGDEGGDARLAKAVRRVLEESNNNNNNNNSNSVTTDLSNKNIFLTMRLGYRTTVTSSTSHSNNDQNNKNNKNGSDDPKESNGSPSSSNTSTTSTSSEVAQSLLLSRMAEEWPGDVLLEEHPLENRNYQPPQQQPEQQSAGTAEGSGSRVVQRVLHNVSSDYIQHAIVSSPLFQLTQDYSNVKLIPLLHNPEVQKQQQQQFGVSTNDVVFQKVLVQAFVALEQVVKQYPNRIHGFGVVSHGLTLPSSHPMHLDWKNVLFPAAAQAAAVATTTTTDSQDNHPNIDTTSSGLSVIQLAANVLEPRGIQIANAIYDHVFQNKEEEQLDLSGQQQTQLLRHDPPLQIWVMRPLTSYAHYTEIGFNRPMNVYPRKLVDVPLQIRSPLSSSSSSSLMNAAILQEPSTTNDNNNTLPSSSSPDLLLSSEISSQWSHLIGSSSSPLMYTQALAKAMSHFDATDLLEKKQRGDELLSTMERETWDGCKLLQSMLHDLDYILTNTLQWNDDDNNQSTSSSTSQQPRYFTSWDEYQDYLFTQVIPLLHDTFEEYDDESGSVLQEFFAAYGVAIQHALSHQTRRMIVQQYSNNNNHDNNNNSTTTTTLPPTMPMQEFALRCLLESRIAGVIVGCSQPKQVLDNIHMFETWTKEQHVSK